MLAIRVFLVSKREKKVAHNIHQTQVNKFVNEPRMLTYHVQYSVLLGLLQDDEICLHNVNGINTSVCTIHNICT